MTWVWFFFSIRLSDHPPYLYVAKHFHWEVKSNHKQKCLDSNQWNCQSINWYFIRSDFKINAMGWRYTCTTLLLRGSSIIEPIWNDLWERQIIENSLYMRIFFTKFIVILGDSRHSETKSFKSNVGKNRVNKK